MKEMILAVAQDRRSIGNDNSLIIHNKDDLKLFKHYTVGKNCIMGRKTYESILNTLGKPLPNRFNIVISTTLSHSLVENVFNLLNSEIAYVPSLSFLEYPESKIKENYIIIGGRTLYEKFIEEVDIIYLTVHKSDLEGNVKLSEKFVETLKKDFMITSRTNFEKFVFYIYKRKEI